MGDNLVAFTDPNKAQSWRSLTIMTQIILLRQRVKEKGFGPIGFGFSAHNLFLVRLTSALFVIMGVTGCSSTKTKPTAELSDIRGKKVALVSIDGDSNSQKIVEVALVNQLISRGTFVLVSKGELERARSVPQQDPLDSKGLARAVKADYALQAKVLKFEALTEEGYSTEESVDSQLAEEQGNDGKTQRVFKLKSLEGQVQVQLLFDPVGSGEPISGTAEAHKRVEASAKSSSIHLPPRLRFLESLTNQAFKSFFEHI